ncbi:MAG TPA: APC family permease [Streptosporangiaceae bacterium]|nr:APC family permease [Streptosporangiaceae bacterium]
MTDSQTRTAAAGTGLRRDAVGLREVLFQSITDMAPGAAIAASIPAGVAFAGGALPLAVVFALVASLFTAWTISQLAKEIPAAGSLATYAARGIHPGAGFLVAWAYVMVGWLVAPLVLLQLGFTTAETMTTEFNWPANLWWPWSIAGMLIVFCVGYFGIRASARLGTILGIFEIAVFLIFAIMLVIRAGNHNTLSVFSFKYTPSGQYHGLSGVIAGSVFTTLAFLGFESAAPLAEEARNPRRTVQLAVLLSTLLIGALYVFTTYAIDVGFGPGKFSSFTTGTGAASWEGVARALYGLFWVLVFFAIINSTIANSNAGVNVASRTAFAMGRVRAFPSEFARVSERHRSPVLAIAVGTVIGLAVMLGLGFGYDPGTAFGMIGTALVITLVGIYLVMNVACIGYFVRKSQGFNLVSHVIVPVLGILAFIPAWLAGAGIKAPGLSFITPLSAPFSYMGPAVAIWMVIGIIYLIVLLMVRRQRVMDVALIHLDEEPTATPDPRVAS